MDSHIDTSIQRIYAQIDVLRREDPTQLNRAAHRLWEAIAELANHPEISDGLLLSELGNARGWGNPKSPALVRSQGGPFRAIPLLCGLTRYRKIHPETITCLIDWVIWAIQHSHWSRPAPPKEPLREEDFAAYGEWEEEARRLYAEWSSLWKR